MVVIELRELRQHASELVRCVEGAEEVTITAAGRPSARLVPVSPRSWRTWKITEFFHGRGEPAWNVDRNRIDSELADPWAPR